MQGSMPSQARRHCRHGCCRRDRRDDTASPSTRPQICTVHCKVSWFPMLAARRKLAGSGYQDLLGGWMDAQTSVNSGVAPRSVTLARRRLRIALLLCATMITIYFGFMALFAFDKPLLGTVLAPGLSLCIVLGPLVIISSFLLCLIYVLWANRVFDPSLRDLER